MKVEVFDNNKRFTPFTITLTIESEQELCDLWYRTESTPDCLVSSGNLVYDADDRSCMDLVSVLDQKVVEYELVKDENTY